MDLTPHEARVIGCLIEKQVVTPEQYPLSLNSLVSACNQKSSREPVMNLEEATVQQILDDLGRKHLVSQSSGFGSRVPKYQQRFCNTGFHPLEFGEQELGVVCVLLLRGPQTAGELRTRTHRLCTFRDAQEVEGVLHGLMNWEQGALLARLPREPGRREPRYAHLFSGEVHPAQETEPESAPQAPPAADDGNDRLALLEMAVDELQSEMQGLRERLDRLEQASRP